MSKRIIFVLITAILLLASSPIAHADAVFSNDFQWRHKDELLKLDRSRFCANGPGGSVTTIIEPGWVAEPSTSEGEEILFGAQVFQNGAEIILDSMYLLNGKYWGVTATGHSYSWPGWIPMDQLMVVYIPADFEAENKDKFYTYTGNYDAIFAADRLVLWQWPGSDREKRVFDNERLDNESINVLHAYKDKDAREWGYVSIEYKYSDHTWSMESWICLTDPDNSQIPSFNPAPKPAEWSLGGIYEWTHVDALDTGNQYALSNIEKVKVYEPNQTFTDIPENAWYKNAVAVAYEYGVIEGKGNNKFDPDGYLTGPEALTIAARIHAYYKYGKEEGSKLIGEYNRANVSSGMMWSITWWHGALEYCKVEDLVKGSDFDYLDNYESYPPPALNRCEMVHAWAKILQPKDMKKQNTVLRLPDVNADTAYSADILLFYEVGIVAGTNAQGAFRPDKNITRAEAATIFMNIIDVSKRHNGRTYG